jgi:DNA (cytosine-5)-methyltransferase 1
MRVIAFSEIEAFAVANLVAKMEAGLLDSAPVWTDLKTFPGTAFRDKVDLLVAGYPCQPFSAAGKRMGAEDPRHLWPYVREQIQFMRPRFCFFENVDGHISMGLREVLADLRALGYSMENSRQEPTWGVFSAAEVDAPHQRKRVFILAARLADAQSEGDRGLPWRAEARLPRFGISGVYVAHDLGQREQELGDGESGGAQLTAVRNGGAPAWPSRPGEEQHRWEPPRVTTGRVLGNSLSYSDRGAHRAGRGERKQEENERPGAGGAGDVYLEAQPPLGRDLDGSADWLDAAELYGSCDNRVDELRLLGNGVVPATAERAWRTLYAILVADCEGQRPGEERQLQPT